MKRFGGFEFIPRNNFKSLNLLNETILTQFKTLLNRSNLLTESFNPVKIAPLFQVHPSQAAVITPFSFSFHSFLLQVWYNNKGWPSSVAFLNIFNNALLRGLLLTNNSLAPITDYGITAINHPLPQTQFQLDTDIQTRVAIEMFTAICVIFALAFIPASFLVFLIDERVTTSKHLQFVSGVKGFTYWWANFVWDLANYSVSITFCLIIFLAFGIESYVSGINFLCLLLLLFLYGFAIIPLMYPISYFFKTPSTGFVLVSCINIFVGLMSTVSTITLDNFDDEPDLQRINGILTKIFLIFPHYCLGRGLFDMSITHTTNIISEKYGKSIDSSKRWRKK